MRISYWTDNAEVLRPILEDWHKEQNGQVFGLSVNVEDVICDLKCLINAERSDVIVAKDGDLPVGFLAIFKTPSFLGPQMMAIEKYWYVSPSSRTAGILLFNEGKKWTKEHGCSHFITSASNLASDKYEKICRFYRSRKMRLFETSFIIEV